MVHCYFYWQDLPFSDSAKEGGIFYYSESRDVNPLPALASLLLRNIMQQVAYFTPYFNITGSFLGTFSEITFFVFSDL